MYPEIEEEIFGDNEDTDKPQNPEKEFRNVPARIRGDHLLGRYTND